MSLFTLSLREVHDIDARNLKALKKLSKIEEVLKELWQSRPCMHMGITLYFVDMISLETE